MIRPSVRLLRKLATTPGWLLTIYGLLIPTYAIIYALNADNFYHSALDKENGYNKYREQFIETMLEGIRTEMVRANMETECYPEIRLMPDTLELFALEFYEPTEMTGLLDEDVPLARFSATFKITENNIEKDFGSVFLVEALYSLTVVSGELAVAGLITFPAKGFRRECVNKSTMSGVAQRPLDDSAPSYGRLNFDSPNDPVALAVSGYYRLVVDGNPAGMDSTFGGVARMLYLSIITLTTLGYGDIVPTSTLTRLLVGSQAFIGIVVIGLFLSSLSKRRR